MKSLASVCVLLLFVFSVKVNCCDEEYCLKQERDALTSLMSHGQLRNTYCVVPVKIPKCSILAHSTDCCDWEGVECNTTTGRVIKLQLDLIGQLNYSDLIIFKDLKTLDLSDASLSNCTTTDQGYFSYKFNMYSFHSLSQLLK
jgi:hypothetical protein